MAADDVSLPDLEVIAQFSLAVRAATAPRAQVVAALEADLAALTGKRRTATPRPGSVPGRAASSPPAARRPAPAEPAPAAGRTPGRRSARPTGSPAAPPVAPASGPAAARPAAPSAAAARRRSGRTGA